MDYEGSPRLARLTHFALPFFPTLKFSVPHAHVVLVLTIARHRYWYTDNLGIIVFQDSVQKYGGATNATIAPFMSDLTAMINGKRSHPSIVQWTAFNEQDCWEVFDVKATVDYVRYTSLITLCFFCA